MDAGKPPTFGVTIPGIGVIQASAEKPFAVHLRALMKQDDGQKFWINRNWPEDAYGKVFLARAAIRVGETMFPDDWTGYEPGVDTTLAALPRFPSQAVNWDARRALEALPQDQRVPVLERLSSIPMPRGTIDQRDWTKAVELRELALAALEAPRARWAAAKYRLREAMKMDPAEVGAVKFHVLDATTGDYSPALPHKWWNTTENWQARFYWCQINVKQPITPTVGGAGFQRIFIDGDDLVTLLASLLPKVDPASAGKNLISDQRALEMYLMEAVATSPMKITRTFEKDIKPWMKANAPSMTERGYREVRKIVLSRFEEHKWGKVSY